LTAPDRRLPLPPTCAVKSSKFSYDATNAHQKNRKKIISTWKRRNENIKSYAKRSFYRAANGTFAKIGRLASEEVMVQILKQKCLPILLYALDVCNLDKRSMQSLDFTFNRFFMKLFKTSNMEIVNCCQRIFGCDLPSTLLKQRFEKFIATL